MCHSSYNVFINYYFFDNTTSLFLSSFFFLSLMNYHQEFCVAEFNNKIGTLQFPNKQCTQGIAPQIVCFNREYEQIRKGDLECLLNFTLHSFICFENILSAEDESINHFTTITLDKQGYHIYDDLLNLDGWQGGLVPPSSPCYKENLCAFMEQVPVFVLQSESIYHSLVWISTHMFLKSAHYSQYMKSKNWIMKGFALVTVINYFVRSLPSGTASSI